MLKKQFGFAQGFAIYDDEMPRSDPRKISSEYAERRAGEVVDRATRWLATQSGRPFFLWVHLFDPHSPYDPPSPFREKYRGRLYDGEIAYTDQQLGRLLAATSAKPGNTLIAVMSDHGESLSDHGEYTHGIFLYDSTIRIAFLLAGPGIPAGLRVKPLARNIDLLPTVLESLDIKMPASLQGTSLTPAFKGKEPAAWSYEESLYSKINMGWAELRGIRTNRWMYVRAPKTELYDLVQDPSENNNVIAHHPTEVRQLDAILQSVTGSIEKVTTTTLNAQTLRQLKSLGYLGGSSASQSTLTGKGIDPKDRRDVLKLLYLAVSPDANAEQSQRVELLRRALAQDPANPAIYYHLGDAYSKASRTADAMSLYQDGIRNGLNNAWLFSRLGYLYLQKGNKDEAISAYERAAQLNPSDSESLNDLGMAYLETGKLADAERVFQWAVIADVQSAPAYNGLGLVSIQKRDVPKARGFFEQAVHFDPDLLEAQLNLGRIYKIMGDNEHARACFDAFLAKASPAEYGAVIAKIREELAAMR